MALFDASNNLVGTFSTIQAAVNASLDNYSIVVGQGTYVEQVVVNNIDGLTIVADTGAVVTIQAPADVVQTGTKASGQGVEAVVTVLNSIDVTIDNINVYGFGAGGTVTPGNDFVGVFYRNSSGSLLTVDVTAVRDAYVNGTTAGGHPNVSGVQRGQGILVSNDNGPHLAFTMTGGSVTDFQKTGINIRNADLNLSGVVITGGGALTTTAQNGLQVQLSTGTIDGNTITGIGYANPGDPNTYSAGMLLFGNTDLDVTGNTVIGANLESTGARINGIWFFDFGIHNSGGEITGNTVDHTDTAIQVEGGVTPDPIDIHGNTVTNVDLTDPFAAGVYYVVDPANAVPYDVEGTSFLDFFGGGAAADTFTGLGGNDLFQGNAGDDTLHGDAGFDRADYSGDFADYTIVYELDMDGNIIGFAEVTDNNAGDGDEGHDTLSSIEVLGFNNGAFVLDLNDRVRLFDGNTLISTFDDIQDAIDAASNGNRIVAAVGTYNEDLTVNKDVTIEGANDGLAGDDPARGIETSVRSFVITASGVTIDGVEVTGSITYPGSSFPSGIYVIGNNFSLVDSVLNGPSSAVGIVTQVTQNIDVGNNLITGYGAGAYVSSGTSTGSFHDNLFQGDGPGSGTGTQNGILTESTLMLIENNTFDGIDGGSIYALPQGPGDTLDLLDIIIGNIISDSGAERPIQIYPSTLTPNVLGTDENEAFIGDWGGLAGIDLSFNGRGGNDHVFGDSGNDEFTGGTGNDLLDGNAGVDTAVFADANLAYFDTVLGWVVTSSEGNDFLEDMEIVRDGSGQRNLLVGATGFAGVQAALNAANNSDNVRLATGSYGGMFSYADSGLTVIAQPGAVLNATFTPSATQGITIVGANLIDTITTGAGNDTLDGGGGADTVAGGAGDDQYFVDAGDVVIEAAGGGFDIVYASASYVLSAGAAVEVLGTVNEAATTAINLTGNELVNFVTGNAGANTLDGGTGADVLWGRGGNDSYFVDSDDVVVEYVGDGYDIVYARSSHVLQPGFEIEVLGTVDNFAATAINLTGNELGQYVTGNAGANVIDGGAGADYLQGRGGADTFAFTTALGGGNVDELADFLSGTDKIALDDALFGGIGTPGSFNANAFVIGAAAQDADDRIVYNQATGQLFYDADGNGAGAQVLFALVAGLPALTASDFTVI